MRVLVRPFSVADEPAALAARAQFAGSGFEFLAFGYSPDIAWTQWLSLMERYRRGVDLPEGYVRSAFLAADVDGELVGRVSIRFDLNEFLATRGGHIGYGIIPAFRRRGLATDVLTQALVIARSEGVEKVLVTCDDDNVGSATVIERCGGALESVTVDGEGVAFRRYWI